MAASSAWTQRKGFSIQGNNGLWIQLHAMWSAFGCGYQVVTQQINQTHFCLEKSKPFSDASMRTKAKGHVGVGRVKFPIFWGEPFRQELSRLWEVLVI